MCLLLVFSSFFSFIIIIYEPERMLMMMTMMMKKKKGSLAVMALLVASVNCVINPSTEHLNGEFHYKTALKQLLLCEFSFILIKLIPYYPN